MFSIVRRKSLFRSKSSDSLTFRQFGESQKVPRIKLTEVLQAIIDSLASPDSDSIPNSLVIIGHNISNDIERLLELKISELQLFFEL